MNTETTQAQQTQEVDQAASPERTDKLRTLLICHEGAELDREGLTRWLASFSAPVGIILLREKSGRTKQRVRREIERIGYWRFLDVVAFRLYYRALLRDRDQEWEQQELARLRLAYPHDIADVPVLETHSPNSAEAEQFMRAQQPDIVIARCKTLIKEQIFTIPAHGTYVMHPGVCPEYRNAHGCFWAMANDDWERVGMTLLRIDRGVDTGPVFGYYTYPYDARRESHIRIQHRVVTENLPALAEKFHEIAAGRAATVDTSGRMSAVWGHPWLTRYLRLRRRARRRREAQTTAQTNADGERRAATE